MVDELVVSGDCHPYIGYLLECLIAFDPVLDHIWRNVGQAILHFFNWYMVLEPALGSILSTGKHASNGILDSLDP